MATDTARLVVLADQLLDLERATLPPGPITSPGDLADAVRRAAARARSRLTDSGRAVSFDDDRAAAVAMTYTVLDQVLGNLVDNAALHGSGQVSVSATSTGGCVLTTVHDAGETTDPAFVPHAVERFRREDAARSTPGNGLGLALVHQLVEQHGGELRFCVGGLHHRFPPLRHDISCAHSDRGTAVTVLLPGFTSA